MAAFIMSPMTLKCSGGWVVNTSSVNSFCVAAGAPVGGMDEAKVVGKPIVWLRGAERANLSDGAEEVSKRTRERGRAVEGAEGGAYHVCDVDSGWPARRGRCERVVRVPAREVQHQIRINVSMHSVRKGEGRKEKTHIIQNRLHLCTRSVSSDVSAKQKQTGQRPAQTGYMKRGVGDGLD